MKDKTPVEEIKVTGCHNCPFAETTFNTPKKGQTQSLCLSPSVFHSRYNIDKFYKEKRNPNWCPLKKAKLFIHLKEK